LRNIVGTPFGTRRRPFGWQKLHDKKFTIVRLDCGNPIHAPPPL
jgi:hypothetical protein